MGQEVREVSKLAIILGVVVLAVALGAAPMPLTTQLEDPVRTVTIFPNLLFAVPLMLLGALLLLYGVTANHQRAG